MTYIYKQSHIPKTTQNNRRPIIIMNATTLTIHNTGNLTSTAQNERNWLTNPDNKATASFHIVIDEKEAIECLPLNEVGWHAGDGSGAKSGNKTSIGIEICESGDYVKTLDNAIKLVANMLKERGWGTDKLRRHYDWSGKQCPRKMNTDGKWSGWFAFLKSVGDELKGDEIMSTKKYEVIKERISLNGNSLKFHTLNTDSGKATDIRHIVIPKGKAKYSLIYEKNKKVSELVKSNKADLGINCTFYNMDNGIPSGYFKDSKGKVQSSAYGKTLKWTQLNVGYDDLTISNLDTKRTNPSFQTAPLIVENGVVCYEKYIIEHEVNSDIANSKRQRTFIWWDKKENIHIGIGDGGVKSNTFDVGLTVKEAALYAIHHGATKAVLFDGGGSTILADQTGGLNQSENRGVNERINHHALLITFKTDEEIDKENQVKEEPVKSETRYSDVPKAHWGYGVIESVATKGIINGYPDGTYRPDQTVSRAEMAAIVERILKLK